MLDTSSRHPAYMMANGLDEVMTDLLSVCQMAIRRGAATLAHDLHHAAPFPRAGRRQNLAQAACTLHPKFGFHRAPRMFEYVRRD
jgi:hypothetical protein